MVEVSNKHKSITVSVSSNNGNTIVAASSDTSQYWANQSHTFANQSKVSAQEAKNYAELANSYIEGFEGVVSNNTNNIITTSNDFINQINTTKEEAVENITTVKSESIADINNTKTNIITDIEFVADDEKEEIKDLANLIKENAQDIANRTSFAMFDTILKDHILTYEETKGLALQGTYVYKEAIAGSRYGYPDFYNKCLEEYNGTTSTETVNGVTVKVNPNGHKFYDIADKTAIDNYFNSIGSAWFYGIDTENERVFLPRNNWFEQAGDISEVGQSVEAGLPNITSLGFPTISARRSNISTGAMQYESSLNKVETSVGGSYWSEGTLYFNASKSNQIYGKSNTVQPNAVKKLLYICVGNTTNYEGITDVVNQGMEILEQVAQKVNIDGTNLNAEGKSLISSLAMPSDKYVNLTLGASGTRYTAPANGWVFFSARMQNAGDRIFVYNDGLDGTVRAGYLVITHQVTQALAVTVPVKKGDIFRIGYGAYTEILGFRFTYAVGSESEA